jgi:hypothetical protein
VGAAIHLGVGRESLSDGLLRQCAGAPLQTGVQR